eukprot:6490598-Amphidinium_carterae.3
MLQRDPHHYLQLTATESSTFYTSGVICATRCHRTQCLFPPSLYYHLPPSPLSTTPPIHPGRHGIDTGPGDVLPGRIDHVYTTGQIPLSLPQLVHYGPP